jgi:hypothetical protein
VNQTDASVYVAIKTGTHSPSDIAKRTGVRLASVQVSIALLKLKGLVFQCKSSHTWWVKQPGQMVVSAA